MRMLSRWAHRVIVLAAIAWSGSAGAASAQTPARPSMTAPSLAAVQARVPVGDVVYVTDMTGATLKGALVAITDAAVQVSVGTGIRSVGAADVRQIQWRQPDSLLSGVLIGAGVGAIPGIYWLAADPNECRGLCPEDYASILVGAVAGGLIDRAVRKTVTVYTSEAPGDRAPRVTIGPLMTRDRKGVQVAVRF